eukprot:10971791-Heterocapsa_arctica.AAC.1
MTVEGIVIPSPETKDNHKKTKGGNSQPTPKSVRTSPWNIESAPPTKSTEPASPSISRPTEGTTQGARRTSPTSAQQQSMGSKASSSNSTYQPGNN